MAAPSVRCLGRLPSGCLACPRVVANVRSSWRRLCATTTTTTTTTTTSADKSAVSSGISGRGEAISRAMQAYLERAVKHDAMMKEQVAEYEQGRRHLANIMWADPETFTQAEIDKAIAYLLPSGLFEKKARPMMKHPSDIFAKRKAAQFDALGRPFHYLFYTGQPNYYELLHEISVRLEKLDQAQETAARQRQKQGRLTVEPLAAPIEEQANVRGTEWIAQRTLQDRLIEHIDDNEYRRFVLLFERLSAHPLSSREQEFISLYRRRLDESTQQQPFSNSLQIDESSGRLFSRASGKRKTAQATVTVYSKGSGEFAINELPITYFTELSYREQVMSPLHFTNKLGYLDVVATVTGGGPSCQSGAVRLALSRALCAFVDSGATEQMRQAGLLTLDVRERERKKPGQPEARKKKTWKKR